MWPHMSFAGQLITDRDVVETTIAMGLISEPPKPVEGCCNGHMTVNDCTEDCIPF